MTKTDLKNNVIIEKSSLIFQNLESNRPFKSYVNSNKLNDGIGVALNKDSNTCIISMSTFILNLRLYGS